MIFFVTYLGICDGACNAWVTPWWVSKANGAFVAGKCSSIILQQGHNCNISWEGGVWPYKNFSDLFSFINSIGALKPGMGWGNCPPMFFGSMFHFLYLSLSLTLVTRSLHCESCLDSPAVVGQMVKMCSFADLDPVSCPTETHCTVVFALWNGKFSKLREWATQIPCMGHPFYTVSPSFVPL